MAGIKQICVRCDSKETKQWWKCCPKHVTETGPDVLCETCLLKLHPGYAEKEG